ncbi:MAG: hypothetical protein L6R40_008056 [Gallowayella cf. fulva]|nr:MAG: hypothetical protein L6R40_008056 [Xanthomendoza cf. fulva]
MAGNEYTGFDSSPPTGYQKHRPFFTSASTDTDHGSTVLQQYSMAGTTTAVNEQWLGTNTQAALSPPLRLATKSITHSSPLPAPIIPWYPALISPPLDSKDCVHLTILPHLHTSATSLLALYTCSGSGEHRNGGQPITARNQKTCSNISPPSDSKHCLLVIMIPHLHTSATSATSLPAPIPENDTTHVFE